MPYKQNPGGDAAGVFLREEDGPQCSAGAGAGTSLACSRQIEKHLICSLLWGGDPDVIRNLRPEDLGPNAEAIMRVICSLSAAGKVIGPPLVLAELRRIGAGLNVIDLLRQVVDSGADPTAARALAAAAVSESLRRRTESAGRTLCTVAYTAPDEDLLSIVSAVYTSITDADHRLSVLRGESS